MADKLTATFHGASLTDTLRPILAAYRAEVQPHWSPATAHPDFDGKVGDPAGQCGVTSAWAQWKLREDHDIYATYCVGDVFAHGKLALRDHCWLEIMGPLADLIVDLTASQMDVVSDLPVLYASNAELQRSGIHYIVSQRLVESQVSRDPVDSRLALLNAAVTR